MEDDSWYVDGVKFNTVETENVVIIPLSKNDTQIIENAECCKGEPKNNFVSEVKQDFKNVRNKKAKEKASKVSLQKMFCEGLFLKTISTVSKRTIF